ncbi:dUTP diphosphatase [Fusobacterium nucleatum]|uniref:dUTP diphosphatase n=1 Tax=Fusobacterium nucleatum TaxID=851 RepID=UPI0030CF6C0C
MEFKRPENFEDILKLQKHLDKNLNNVRPRCLRDIKMSLIAECVEFNEETKESHKTWKTKEYNKSMELEELTDIYFFFAQMINFNEYTVNNYARIKHLVAIDFNCWQIKDYGSHVLPTLNLIDNIINDNVLYAIDNLMEMAQKLGYSKDDILNCYWEKWQKNMKRIGKEWN